ncbi:MAG: hypothetical protein OXC91_03285 [Rhodobacteraceae bacterium]|nr:hypothetical protein [Paracoccaceae bacterium]
MVDYDKTTQEIAAMALFEYGGHSLRSALSIAAAECGYDAAGAEYEHALAKAVERNGECRRAGKRCSTPELLRYLVAGKPSAELVA